MPLSKLWTLAYRDLGRNRRRSVLSLLAVALGLALLIILNGYIAGTMEGTLQNSIRLRTGHLQLRASSYEEEQQSLEAKNLLIDPEQLAARASALPEVHAATPVLWASGILETIDDSAGLQIHGVDSASPLYTPIRDAIVAGTYLAPDDRSGILIGKRLADSMNVGVGQKVNLAIVNSDGRPDEGIFEIRGLFATGVPSYDESTVFMPLSKAQAFTGTTRHASAIVILLNNQDDTEKVAATLRGPDITTLTWSEMNELFVQLMQTSMNIYVVLDAIVMLIVAVIIANTLLMSVFERIREMGILTALGMKGRSLLQMYLLEAGGLGLAGVAIGLVLGLAGVAYLAIVGIPLGDQVASVGGSGLTLASTVYARFVPGTFAALSLAMLLIVSLASLYPARYAARLEPVEALRAE
jgi:ABC-type lipoprotein release transport system permease subunit